MKISKTSIVCGAIMTAVGTVAASSSMAYGQTPYVLDGFDTKVQRVQVFSQSAGTQNIAVSFNGTDRKCLVDTSGDYGRAILTIIMTAYISQKNVQVWCGGPEQRFGGVGGFYPFQRMDLR